MKASFLAVYNAMKEQEDKGLRPLDISPCCLIVDSGYSSTYAIPYFDYNPINYAIKRYIDFERFPIRTHPFPTVKNHLGLMWVESY
jgi:hypothetical protein